MSAGRGNNRAAVREVYEPDMEDAKDRGNRAPEMGKGALQGPPDTQAARNAGASDLKAAEAIRTNQSDGSLRKYVGLAYQNQSIELVYEGRVTSRTQAKRERDLLAEVPKEAKSEQSKTMQDLESAAKTNPVAEVLLGFKQQAEGMKPGPGKERLIKLAKEQAAELLAPRASDDQESSGAHNALSSSQSHSAEIISQAYRLDYAIEKQRQKAQEDSHKRLDGKNASSNDQFLDMFLNGSGNDVQVHSKRGEPVLEQFIKSAGVQFIREQYYKQGCPAKTGKLSYGTKEAFVDTVAKPVVDSFTHGFTDLFDEQHLGSVGTQVGGFGNPPKEYPWAVAKATRCSQDGKADEKGAWVQFEVNNIAGAHSWGAHALPDRPV